MVDDGVGYSSQAIRKPPEPSPWIDEPCEFVEPGTDRIVVGATEPGPCGKIATLIGEGTFTPEHDPNCVHETRTFEPLRAIAGLSWNCFLEFPAIWKYVQAPLDGLRRSRSTSPPAGFGAIQVSFTGRPVPWQFAFQFVAPGVAHVLSTALGGAPG